MLTSLSIICICIANIIFFGRRCLRYLFHFQQEDYSREYFSNWLIENGVYDKKGTLIATCLGIVSELVKSDPIWTLVISIIGSILLVSLGLCEPDPRKGCDKTRLRNTRQAIVIYWRSLILYSFALTVAFNCIYWFSDHDDLAVYWLSAIVSIQSSPIWIMLAKPRKC